VSHPLDFTQPGLAERVRALDPVARRALAVTAAGRAADEQGLEHPALSAARAGKDAYAALAELLAELESQLDAHDPGPIGTEVVDGALVVPEAPEAWTRAMRAAAAARAHWALLDPDELAAALGALDQALLATADARAFVRALP